jgi:hypothetical protein
MSASKDTIKINGFKYFGKRINPTERLSAIDDLIFGSNPNYVSFFEDTDVTQTLTLTSGLNTNNQKTTTPTLLGIYRCEAFTGVWDVISGNNITPNLGPYRIGSGGIPFPSGEITNILICAAAGGGAGIRPGAPSTFGAGSGGTSGDMVLYKEINVVLNGYISVTVGDGGLNHNDNGSLRIGQPTIISSLSDSDSLIDQITLNGGISGPNINSTGWNVPNGTLTRRETIFINKNNKIFTERFIQTPGAPGETFNDPTSFQRFGGPTPWTTNAAGRSTIVNGTRPANNTSQAGRTGAVGYGTGGIGGSSVDGVTRLEAGAGAPGVAFILFLNIA